MSYRKWSYIAEPDPNPPRYSTLPDLLDEQAHTNPDRICCLHCSLTGKEDSITFQKLMQQSRTLAKHLVHIGMQRGDCIALIGPNSIPWVVAEYGIIMAGGIAVNVTISLNDASDFTDFVNESGIKCLILGDVGSDLTDMVVQQAKNINLVIIRIQGETEGINNLSSILAGPEPDDELPTIYPEDGAFVFTTSGSTGEYYIFYINSRSFGLSYKGRVQNNTFIII